VIALELTAFSGGVIDQRATRADTLRAGVDVVRCILKVDAAGRHQRNLAVRTFDRF